MTTTRGDTAITISLIVAVAENGVIGRDGDLPWRMSSDLKAFRRITMGKPIIMGRKTFATLAKPLDGRTNIVATRSPNFKAPEGVVVTSSVDAALAVARDDCNARASASNDYDKEVMIIGGAELYRQTLGVADRVYLTEVHATPDGDTMFPELSQDEWQETSSQPLPRGPRDDHAATLRVLERIKPPTV